MNKKHQIFVSSTHDDLIDERKEVSQAILESGCIPAGMELFPATNNRTWDIIKKVIDDCDYYLLIIAGRYGTTRKFGNNNISYTELEYNYAVKTHKPIIAFICSKKISDMKFDKVEDSAEGRRLLEKFKEKVKNRKAIVNFWDDTGQLVSKVKTSIQNLKETVPAPGWIKCSDLGITGSDQEIDNIVELMSRWGIEKIFKTRAEKNRESDPRLEKHNIKKLDGIAFGLRSFRTLRENDILECLNNGANIRLLTMDPHSDFVKQRALEENDDTENIAKSIKELVEWADNLNNRSTYGNIQVKYYNAMTLDFYWRIDEELYIGPYWYGTISQQTITYKFKNGGLGFTLYTEYFERLWKDKDLTRIP